MFLSERERERERRKRESREFLSHESSSIRVNITTQSTQRANVRNLFLSIERSKARKREGRKTRSFSTPIEIRWPFLRFVRRKGDSEKSEKARWRCRNKEISGVTRHEFSCKARVHYDLSNPHCRHAAFLDARPRRMAKLTSRLMPIGVVLTRAVL